MNLEMHLEVVSSSRISQLTTEEILFRGAWHEFNTQCCPLVEDSLDINTWEGPFTGSPSKCVGCEVQKHSQVLFCQINSPKHPKFYIYNEIKLWKKQNFLKSENL